MTISEDARIYECLNCYKQKVAYTKDRYIPCDNPLCIEDGYLMGWVG